MRELWGQLPFLVQALLALALVLALVAVIFFVIRRLGAASASKASGRARQPRLGVIDVASIDGRRRLVIIRRDAVEHLLMIGGPNDVVIEANIVRAQNPAQLREERNAQVAHGEEADMVPAPPLARAPRDQPATSTVNPAPRGDTRQLEPKRPAMPTPEALKPPPVITRPPSPAPRNQPPVDQPSAPASAPYIAPIAKPKAAPVSAVTPAPSPRSDPPMAAAPVPPPPAMAATTITPRPAPEAPMVAAATPAPPAPAATAKPTPPAAGGEVADLEAEMASILGHLSAPPRT